MSQLLSFSGYPGAGKDTAYDLMQWNTDSIQKLKFAYPIQDTVCLLAGLYQSDLSHRELFEKREWKENHLLFPSYFKVGTPRQAAQVIGHNMRDLIGDRVWIDKLDKERLASSKELLIITDTRYKNEVDYVQEVGGLVIFIDRPQAEQEAKANPIFNHASEAYLDSIRETANIIIDNSGTYEELIVTLRNELLPILSI